jgi:sigma-B regulation protein RsbQ
MTRAQPIDLVLLPGMDGTALMFAPLIDALPPNIRPRPVGYPCNDPLGYQELLPQVRAALPRDAPFLLLGESFSGPLALMAAAESPPGLIGVILCASFIHSPVRWSRLLLPLVSAFTFALVPRRLQTRAVLAGQGTPWIESLLARATGMVPPAVMAARARAILEVDASRSLADCTVPLLYLRARDDRLVPEKCSRRIAVMKPGARQVTLPGPHMILQTLPAESAAAIAAFAVLCAASAADRSV